MLLVARVKAKYTTGWNINVYFNIYQLYMSRVNNAHHSLHQPGNCNLGVVVSIPTNTKAKGRLQGDVLTSKTQSHEGRWGVRQGHLESIDLPHRRRKRGHQVAEATAHICFLPGSKFRL